MCVCVCERERVCVRVCVRAQVLMVCAFCVCSCAFLPLFLCMRTCKSACVSVLACREVDTLAQALMESTNSLALYLRRELAAHLHCAEEESCAGQDPLVCRLGLGEEIEKRVGIKQGAVGGEGAGGGGGGEGGREDQPSCQTMLWRGETLNERDRVWRSQVETRSALSMLKGEVRERDVAILDYELLLFEASLKVCGRLSFFFSLWVVCTYGGGWWWGVGFRL